MEEDPLPKDAPGRTTFCPKGLQDNAREPVSTSRAPACSVPLAVWSNPGGVNEGRPEWLELLFQAALSHPASGWKRRPALCQGLDCPTGKLNESLRSGASPAEATLPVAAFCSWTLSLQESCTGAVLSAEAGLQRLLLTACASHGAFLFRKHRPILKSKRTASGKTNKVQKS